MRQHFREILQLSLIILVTTIVAWTVFDKPQLNIQHTVGANTNSLLHETKKSWVSDGVLFEPNTNGLACLSPDAAKAIGLEIPWGKQPSITVEHCIQAARKYGLSLEEARTLLEWHNKFGSGAEDDVEANKVAAICIKNAFTRSAVRELLGPCGIECPQGIYFTYYPGRNLLFTFGSLDTLVAVELAGKTTVINAFEARTRGAGRP